MGWTRRAKTLGTDRRTDVSWSTTQGKGRRALALLLTGVLSFEAAFGNGLTAAFAEPLSTDAGTLEIIQGETDLTDEFDSSHGMQDSAQDTAGATSRDAFDWTGCTAQLKLSSTGTLAIDYDALNAQADDEQTDNLVDSEATGDVSAEGADEQLPEELPATIDFSFTLDPANPDGSSVVGGAFQEGQAARPGAPGAGDASNVALPAAAVLLGTLFVAGAVLVKRRIRA